MQDVSDRYDRVVRVLGENAVDDAVQQDIQEQKALEEEATNGANANRKYLRKTLPGEPERAEMENQQRKKNKIKTEGMER